MGEDLTAGLIQLLSGENSPGGQNMQLRSGYGGAYNSSTDWNQEGPPNTETSTNAPVSEVRPMKMDPIWHFLKDRMGGFGTGLRMKERMTSYWNPQTQTWDKDKADGVTYGSSQYYNFDTGEYREPTEYELNPHKFNPMSPSFNPFGNR